MLRPTGILVAINARERQEFLPEPLWSELLVLAGRCVWADTNQLGEGQFERLLADIDPEILVSCWSTQSLPACLPPRLRYVCHLGGSVRKLVNRSQLLDGLRVTNWGGSVARYVAECALLHTLACLRRLADWTLKMHSHGAWGDAATLTASLFERRVGLHGFGFVAREFTGILRPFNCHVSVCAPDVDACAEARYGVKCSASLEALFAENDIIVELAPLLPATVGTVTEQHLRLIRPGGVFVNVGRGAVVDEKALLRVAMEGHIIIGLDVYHTEPLPPDYPLRGLPNVVLTPHIGGPTTDRRRDVGELALENIRAYTRNRPLSGSVTTSVYDSST